MNQTDFKEIQDRYSEDIEFALEKALCYEKPIHYGALLEAVRYSVLDGGKRLRGILALAFCKLFSGEHYAALPAACSLEMFHAYTLVHDDLPCMDNDTLRRGKPSCWSKFGEAEALLAGDALLTLSFETLCAPDNLLCKRIQLAQIRSLATSGGQHGVIAGQVLDMEAEKGRVSYDFLRQIHLLKTGKLILAAVEMGSLAGEASDDELQHAREYALHLGLQFQIVDDLLDVIGEESALGKPIGSDTRNEKTTYVSLFGVEETKRLAQKETEAALKALENISGDKAFLEMLTWSMLHRLG